RARGCAARRGAGRRADARAAADGGARRGVARARGGAVSAADRARAFAALHVPGSPLLMPNPWDAGSARLLASLGFQALATTSAGFAWSLGRLDQHVARDELVAHVAALAAATDLPLNVDSERCYPDDSGGVAETGALLDGAAYGALVSGARELLPDGTPRYAEIGSAQKDLRKAFA